MRMRAMEKVETERGKTDGVLYETKGQAEQHLTKYHNLCRLKNRRRRPRRIFPHSEQDRSWR